MRGNLIFSKILFLGLCLLGSSVFASEHEDFETFIPKFFAKVNLKNSRQIKNLDCSATLENLKRMASLTNQRFVFNFGLERKYKGDNTRQRLHEIKRLTNPSLQVLNRRHLAQLTMHIRRLFPNDSEQISKEIKQAFKNKIALPAAKLFPKFVAKEQGRCGDLGPNCFGTVSRLFIRGDLAYEGYDYEFTELLSSKFRTVGVGEEILYGDVLVFWNADSKEIGTAQSLLHAAFYLDKNLILHKASRNGAHPVTFERLEETLRYYQAIQQPTVITFHRLK